MLSDLIEKIWMAWDLLTAELDAASEGLGETSQRSRSSRSSGGTT